MKKSNDSYIINLKTSNLISNIPNKFKPLALEFVRLIGKHLFWSNIKNKTFHLIICNNISCVQCFSVYVQEGREDSRVLL